jgi:lysophospholipase L1-like esterase
MRIYVLGDSISIQYGLYLQKYLEGVMEYNRKQGDEEALLNLDKPQGANGGDSGMVLSFLRARAASGGIDADLLLLNCGLHDRQVSGSRLNTQHVIDGEDEGW